MILKWLIFKRPGRVNFFDAVFNLFNSFLILGSAENEYVMKCIMRTFSCLQGSVIPFLATLLPVLTQKLQQAAKNPTKPHFNHYIFETFCLAIRIVCTSQPGAVSNFEGKIFSYPDLNSRTTRILFSSPCLTLFRKVFWTEN